MSKMRLVGSTALSALAGAGIAASANAATFQEDLNDLRTIAPHALQEALITLIHDKPSYASTFLEEARARGMRCTAIGPMDGQSYQQIRSAVSGACADTRVSQISGASGASAGFSSTTQYSPDGSYRFQTASGFSGDGFSGVTYTDPAYSQDSKTPYTGQGRVVRTTTETIAGRTYRRELTPETLMVPQQTRILTQAAPVQVPVRTTVLQPVQRTVLQKPLQPAAPAVVQPQAVRETGPRLGRWLAGGAATAGGIGLLSFLLGGNDDPVLNTVRTQAAAVPPAAPDPATPDPAAPDATTPAAVVTKPVTPDVPPAPKAPNTVSTYQYDRTATAVQPTENAYTRVPLVESRPHSATDPLAYLKGCDCTACSQSQTTVNGVSFSYNHAAGNGKESLKNIENPKISWDVSETAHANLAFDTSVEAALGFANNRAGHTLFGDHSTGLAGLGLVNLDTASIGFETGDTTALRITTFKGGDQTDVSGGFLTGSFAPADNLNLGFGVGAVADDGVLGLQLKEGFDAKGSRSGILTGQIRYTAQNDLEIIGMASIAQTDVRLSSGSGLTGAEKITSVGGSLSMVKKPAHAPVDYLSLGLSVPSKVLSGSLTTGSTPGFAGYKHDLAQTGTAVRFDAVTGKTLGEGVKLVAGASYGFNPNRDASVPDGLGFKLGLGLKF